VNAPLLSSMASAHGLSQLACVLHAQRELLSEPSQWTRGALARDLFGQTVVPLSERALRWSLTGSIAPALLALLGPRAANLDWQRLYDASVGALWNALPSDFPRTARMSLDLDGFNDYAGTQHADMLDLIARTIDAVELAISD
jgi:hypothetical protein